jgi:hypothetical protein
MWVGGQCHTPTALLLKRDPVTILQETVWAPGPVWMGVENFAPLGIRSRTVHLVSSRYTDYAVAVHANKWDNTEF